MSESVSSNLSASFPPMVPAPSVELGAQELLIHAPGFEDRTIALPKIVRAPGGGRALLLDYRPTFEENRMGEVRDMLEAKGIDCANDDVIIYDRFEPGDFESRLSSRITYSQCKRVLVDVSTMSKLAILLVLDVCRRMELDTRVFYAEARAYGPTRAEYENAKRDNSVHRPSLQVFTGVQGVVRVDSLASVAMQGEPTAAIVFMSFNNSLTQALLNTVYPSRLLLVNGSSPNHPWREEAKAWIHEQVSKEWNEDNPTNDGALGLPTRVVSTLLYEQSVAMVLGIYWMLSATHRIILAPAGSKMQAVGCYLAKALHPDIHIEYPSPKGFFREYSSEIGDSWIIDFGNLAALLVQIARVERRDYLDIPTESYESNVSDALGRF